MYTHKSDMELDKFVVLSSLNSKYNLYISM